MVQYKYKKDRESGLFYKFDSEPYAGSQDYLIIAQAQLRCGTWYLRMSRIGGIRVIFAALLLVNESSIYVEMVVVVAESSGDVVC